MEEMMNRNDIILIHGTDYKQMARSVVEKADLASLIGSRDKKIALKPNILGTMLPEVGATTHTELVCAVIEYLQDNGFSQISIMEGSWVGDNTAKACRLLGYDKISRQYGVPFIDLQKDQSVRVDAKGMKLAVCKTALEADFVINMPVAKGHCQTVITCALKNNKGVIPNSEKRRFHTMGLHKPIAHLNTVVRNDFILVDNICGDLDFEEGGNPIYMNRVLGFRDPVLCDSFICSSFGFSTDEVEYIGIAEKLGVGCSDLSQSNLIKIGKTTDAKLIPDSYRPRSRVRKLASCVEPDNPCSACYGQLIYALNRLDEEGELGGHTQKIVIGQGYHCKEGERGKIGIGGCTHAFEVSLGGCPPKSVDIYNFLKENWV